MYTLSPYVIRLFDMLSVKPKEMISEGRNDALLLH